MKCNKSEKNEYKKEIRALSKDIKKSKYKPYKREYKKLKYNMEKRLRECKWQNNVLIQEI